MADGGSFALPFDKELVVDLFAGGGGASMGIGRAYREPDIAVNHNAIAVAVHRANHPHTRHFTEDVFDVCPLKVTGGRPIGLLWASPDCRHHSKAKGGAPRNKRIRGLAWIVVRWAVLTAPRMIELENVEEFIDWGPLDEHNQPIKARKGETYRAFVAAMTKGLAADHPAMAEIVEFLGDSVHVPSLVRGLGYRHDHREIRACDKGAPTIRKRLVVKFRRDGLPITWSPDTHAKGGAGGLKPWRTAAECIDFSLQANSIFERKKPLVDNTCKRVAKGLWRYVLACEQPYIVDCNSIRSGGDDEQEVVVRGRPTRGEGSASMGGRWVRNNGRCGPEGAVPAVSCGDRGPAPIRLLSCGPSIAGSSDRGGSTESGIAPFLTEHANSSSQRTFPADEPLRTQVAQVKGGHFSLVAAHVTKFRANSIGSGMDEPLHTITAGGDMKRPAGAAHAMGLVSACMIAAGHGEGQHGRFSHGCKAVDVPLNTVVASGGGHSVMQAHFLEQANGGFYEGDGRPVDAPQGTICAQGSSQRLVSAYLVKYYREGGQWNDLHDPMHTLPTKDRMGLVSVVSVPADILLPEMLAKAKRCADLLHKYLPEHFPEPADLVLVGGYALIDITLRMLVPTELARAQGFHAGYIIDRGLFETAPGSGEYEWRGISKTEQVRLIGNSVCPDVAEAEVREDLSDLINLYAEAA